MVAHYHSLPERSRREVLRDLIARAQIELERVTDPADRRHIEEILEQLEDELRNLPE